jgi:hypothetical protein
VYLKVSPLQGTKRFLMKGKLAPRYVGPYQITKWIGSLAYQLALHETMARVHPVFYMSQLKKSEKEVEANQVPMELLDLQDTLEYAKHPEKILDRVVKETKRTTIPFCKVLLLTPKSGTGERLICGLSLVINSIRQEKSHQRIQQGRLRTAIRLRLARGLFVLIFRGCVTTWPGTEGKDEWVDRHSRPGH